MKIKFYSVLVSIIFIPVAVLSQWIGLYIGKVLYFIYDYIMGLRLPDFIIDTGPTVISGLIAAYISALAVKKIYKNYDIIFVTILPLIVILLALVGDISLANEAGWNSKSIGVIIREILTIYFYFYLLKDKTILN
tara:strand:- start:38 stop:442 length:405 start_codon:yes stop_codon:yes gene_type:complete